jgi:hypothetical protein
LRDRLKAQGKVNFLGATVGLGFVWTGVLSSAEAILDLRSAKVGTLQDEPDSWPAHLFLDGFHYDRIHDEAPLDAENRTDWLHRQSTEKFLPQPYEQLASVLRTMGHEADAKQIMIEKNRDHARWMRAQNRGCWALFTAFFSGQWWWYNVFGWLIGYGYAPWRAFWVSVAVVFLGTALFALGYTDKLHDSLICPTKDSAYVKGPSGPALPSAQRVFSPEYPKFNAFVYSLESFTPFLKLGESENWMINANQGAPVGVWNFQTRWGSLLRYYHWLHIIAGWVLTTLWVGGLTKLVKS